MLILWMPLLLPSAARPDSVLPAGTFSMPALQTGETARPLGMGSAYAGIAEGAASLFWNPAGLGQLKGVEISLHHNSGFGSSNRESALFGMPAAGAGGFAVSLNYQDAGVFEIRDEFGMLLPGTNSASELGAAFGWGVQWFEGFYAGAGIKAVRKNLAGIENYVFAADAGILWKPVYQFSAGLSFQNLGGSFQGSDVMHRFRGGISYKIDAGINNKVIVAAACEAASGGNYRAGFGLENTGYGILSVRLGYLHNFSNTGLEGLSGFTAGLGINIGDLSVDYAFLPSGELGNSHRVSLTYLIPDPVQKKTYLPKTDKRVITFETAYFDHNSYDLSAETAALLIKNIKILRENLKTEIRITGHTSKSGSRDYNKILSERRALAIRNFLVREGDISMDRIFIIGYGDTHPAVFEVEPGKVNSDAARMNRRGLFEIIRQ